MSSNREAKVVMSDNEQQSCSEEVVMTVTMTSGIEQVVKTMTMMSGNERQ